MAIRTARLATALAAALLVTSGCMGDDGERGGRQAALGTASSGREGPPVANEITTVDTGGGGIVGYHGSLALGADGLGLISYQDYTDGDLEVAHCSNTACSTATKTTLDSAGTVGLYTSITIGADGLGLISYYDETNRALKVAHCSNAACTAATTAAVDGGGGRGGVAGLWTSITLGADGLGLISYYDETNEKLKVAHCSNAACSTVTKSVIDNVGNGGSTSLALGADGLGLVSYFDAGAPGGALKVAHCANVACSSATTATLDSGGLAGFHSSVTIDARGLGLIAYGAIGALKTAHCANAACSSAAIATLDGAGNVGSPSITLGADGLGLISYQDGVNYATKVAHCSDAACSTATTAMLDDMGNVGRFTGATLGADGLGLISYLDDGNGDLKVAHCANEFCVSFLRRR